MRLQISLDFNRRLDYSAVAAAIEELQLKLPVTIVFDGAGGALGTWTTSKGGHYICLDSNSIDSPMQDDREQLSFTLWHELGHAKDYETRSGGDPEEIRRLHRYDLDTYYNPIFKEHGFLGMLMTKEAYELYYAIPTEQVADKTAYKYFKKMPLTRAPMTWRERLQMIGSNESSF